MPQPSRDPWQPELALGLDGLVLPPVSRPSALPVPRPRRRGSMATPATEFKVVALRDCPLPEHLVACDTPDKAADYWRLHVATQPQFNPDVETCVVLHLNTRRRVRGHHLVATGTLDTLLVHPREVFRAALVAAAHAIVVLHNHPSGDPSPSEADVRVTRELCRAGQLLRVEVLDHVIVAGPHHASLRALGYCLL